MRTRSLLIINFRSAGWTAGAIESARRSSSSSLQVVVVDNSCDPRELDALSRTGADKVLAAPNNLGYGAGANLGARACEGEDLILCNPDVVFHDDAIDFLADHLSTSAMSGPRFFWDDHDRWLLPPADMATRRSKASEILASRSTAWAGRRDRVNIRKRLSFWNLNSPTAVSALSGAVLCLGKRLFDEMGGFDERFPLYFEEIDLMRRIRRRGGAIHYVPAARCRHAYNQSAGSSDHAPASYIESELRYHRKWSGAFVASLIARDHPRRIPIRPFVHSMDGRIEFTAHPSAVVLEASPLATFDSAAGHFPNDRNVKIPDEILESYQGSELFIRVVDQASAEVLEAYRVHV